MRSGSEMTTYLRRGLAAGLVAALAVTLAAAPASARPPDAEPDRLAGLDLLSPVPAVEGSPVPVRAGAPDRTAERSLSEPHEVAWPAPAVAEVALPPVAGLAQVRAGELPVTVGPAPHGSTVTGTEATADPPGGGGSGTGAATRLAVEVFDQDTAAAAGVRGLLFAVAPADRHPGGPVPVTLTVDYAQFRYAYGGGWSQRLRLVRLPDCDGCAPAELPSVNDPQAGTLTAQVTVGAAGGRFAVTSEVSGAAGDYSASPLSVAGGWEVSTNSGSFQWSYPMPVPEVPGGLVPDVGLGYSSATVDGRTLSTNAQPSVVGEGWAGTDPGFVERSFRSCADDDATPRTGDLCWFSENATLSFGDHSAELVRVGDSRTWRLKADDGTRIRQRFDAGNDDVRGEWWEVTTTDGVQYRFGSRPAAASTWTVPVFGNGPGTGCGGSFDTSDCERAWRWNLDEVVDPRGNTMSYQYVRETNRYDRNLNHNVRTAGYTRGGYLQRIDYGTRSGGSGPAPARVVFGMADRCLGSSCSLSDPAGYPDTPLDLRCTSTTDCGGVASPTFWTTKRLSTVTTQVRVGNGYRDVDRWQLAHVFADPQEEAPESLWLHRIVHTGLAGGGEPVASPPVTFPLGQRLANRVDPGDGDPRLYKFRIDTIHNGTGGQINVVYAPPDCDPANLPAPHTNTTRCFPVTWALPGTEPRQAFFHKYVVASVTEDDLVGGSDAPMVTRYLYHGGAAWRYQNHELIPADKRTWSEFRGYQRVEVRRGSGDDGPVLSTEYRYFRGMHGDRAGPAGGTRDVSVPNSLGERTTDRDQYAGFRHEETVRSGVGGPVVSTTIHDPWHRGPTATQGTRRAFQVEVGASRTRTALGGGQWQTARTDYTYHDEGLVRRIHETADGMPDRCTTVEYARNESTWLLDRPSREMVATTCAADPLLAQLISRTSTFYDGSEVLGAPPSRGEQTKVQVQQWQPGGPAAIHTVARTEYDSFGRVTSATGARGNTTTTDYTDRDGRTASTVVTNPLGHTVTTTLDQWRGQPTRIVDANGRATDLSYDAQGRLTAAWLPGRSRSLTPNHRFAYRVRADGPSWARSERLTPSGGYRTSYQLFDGFLRERQSQTPAAGADGGRVVADTFHDSRGLVSRVYHGYHRTPPPGPDLVGVDGNDIHRQTWYEYDGAGREVERIRKGEGRVELWRTSTRYGGDRVRVTPPSGGTATTTVTDARGQTVELHQHHGPTPEGPADVTRYTYTPAGQLASITDPTEENTWEYTYDLRGRQIRATDPDTGTATMTYDTAGNLLTRTDGRGSTVAYEYDALGRKVARYAGSTGGELLAEWHFDQLAGGGSGALGLPTGATRHHDGHAYRSTVDGYDVGGRMTAYTLTIPAVPDEQALAGSYTTRFSYLADGSLRQVTLPGRAGSGLTDETIIHEYSAAGLPRQTRGVSSAGVRYYVDDTGYQSFGEVGVLTLGTFGSGVSRAFGYDLATRRLTSSRVLSDVGGVTREVEHYQYAYDPAGNVTEIADRPADGPADVQCFDYDHLRRLADAWTPAGGDCGPEPATGALAGPAPYWTSYQYDQAGNRTQETRHATTAGGTDTVRTYQYPAAGQPRPHALQQVTTAGPGGPRTDRYGYDGAGNQLSRDRGGNVQTFTWNPEGRVAEVAASGGSTGFVYDPGGDRLVRRDPEGTTVYLGDQEFRLDRATGQVTGTRYYRHAGHTVAVRVGDRLTWLAGDHHQTDTTAVDAGAGDTTRRRFDPFGNPRGAAATWPGERGFVGGTTDPGLDLVHLGAREYDPDTGRFISVDPILDLSNPAQMHGYAYGNHNPATFPDPTGLLACGGAAAVDGQWCPSPKDGKFSVPKGGGHHAPSGQTNPYGNPRARSGYGNPGCPDGARTCRPARPNRIVEQWHADLNQPYPDFHGPVPHDLRRCAHDPAFGTPCWRFEQQYPHATGTAPDQEQEQEQPRPRPPSERWSLSFCVGGSISLIAFVGGELCGAIDGNGIGYSVTRELGVGLTAGVGVTAGPVLSEATIAGLAGNGDYLQIGGPTPWGVDVEAIGMRSSSGDLSGKLAVGPGIGVSVLTLAETKTESGYLWRR